jgi:DGQHR domain-containing protein
VSPLEAATGAEFPVVRTATRGGTQMAVGVMQVQDLRHSCVIPRRDARTKQGYQREVSNSRVNRLMKDLRENRVDLPTSILVNLRDFDPMVHLGEGAGGCRVFRFDRDKDRLHVVDGQHRVEALTRLFDQDPDKWGNFEIPFVSMLGASEREEIRQFYVVNSTAKSVRTDLALALLKQRVESEPGLMDALIESRETWKVKSQQLVEDIATSPIWKGRIRFPGEESTSQTIRWSGWVNSLKALMHTPYFGAITTANQKKVLDAYWEGIRKVIPEAFATPENYSLQKSTGVMIMHSLLISILELLRSTGRSVIEPEHYADVLGDVLTNLEGDTSEGGVARGSAFWLSGSQGAAGSYSSNAGRRVLLAKLKGALPPIEVA